MPAPVVDAEVVEEPADLELALGELLGREVLYLDVVRKCLLCNIFYIDLKFRCKEPWRSANKRVYLFRHTVFNND